MQQQQKRQSQHKMSTWEAPKAEQMKFAGQNEGVFLASKIVFCRSAKFARSRGKFPAGGQLASPGKWLVFSHIDVHVRRKHTANHRPEVGFSGRQPRQNLH